MLTEQIPSGFAFQELNLQEHAHLLPVGHNAESLVHKVRGILVRRIGNDVAAPRSIFIRKEIEYLVSASVV